MDRLWTPWRAEYIASGGTTGTQACIFCAIRDNSDKDDSNYVLHRAKFNLIVLNRYPYISGHLLIVPYDHVSALDCATKETTDELMDLTKQSQTALRDVYQPSGFNIGMNLGEPAGAGVADHIHIHVLPRWAGDTNFMTTVGNTRVLPEDLATTYQKLLGKF